MMVTVKYVLIILHADNNGEGGTFSTYSLLSRYVSLVLKPVLRNTKGWPLGEHHESGPSRSVSH